MKKDIFAIYCILALLIGCSASKQAFKQAREFEDAGLYVEAAEADLQALDKSPKYKEAKVHLRKVAPDAYAELLSQAQNLETGENWDAAVGVYAHLTRMLSRFQRHGVVLETINVKARLGSARRKAADCHYKNGERLFAAGKWRKAANAYLQAHKFVDNYNKALDKAIQALVNSGNGHLKNNAYNKALKAFAKILDVAPNHPVGKTKLAETHFQMGRAHFEAGEFRQALKEFEKVLAFKPDFEGAEKWVERAYEAAVQYIAVFPFLNKTNVTIDGYLLASDILTRTRQANLQFVDFLSHPATVSLISKSSLSRYGHVSESELLSIANEEGLDSIVWGTIRDLDVQDKPESRQEIAYDKIITVQDSSGKDVEETETIYYREYARERRIVVRLEYVILNVASGAVLDKQRYTREVSDIARWIGYNGSIYDLPEDRRILLDAPRNPRPVEVLVNELLAAATDRISRDVVRHYR